MGSACSRFPPPHRTVTIYLIRHGEASHNVVEARAKAAAKAEVIAEGLDPGSPEAKARIEDARQKVLEDASLFDPPLSEEGRRMAADARDLIRRSIEGGVPAPEVVLTSPLQRALETTALIFSGHPSVHIRDELRERQTGYACDERRRVSKISTRSTFRRFSLVSLQQSSREDSTASVPDFGPGVVFVESKKQLRRRTHALIPLLAQFEATTFAVVGHKGYLRELEHGPMGQADTTEFGNCEVRAYRTKFHPASSAFVAVERIRTAATSTTDAV